ncbi:hypothetical protein KEM52_006148 [Ascosphaera acerosa]|nr:hypothetical protein KEM52_006148 [Ascosphaera acerosa]
MMPSSCHPSVSVAAYLDSDECCAETRSTPFPAFVTGGGGSSSGSSSACCVTDASNRLSQRARRVKSFHASTERGSCDYESDAVYLRVELFLTDLERRLQWLDDYRRSSQRLHDLDAGLKRAYASLEAVRDACSVASGELMGTGKRRAEILVAMLESSYNDVLATKETMEQKAQAGMRMLEAFLNDLEMHVRDRGLIGTLDDGWQALDTSLTHARELVGVVGGEIAQARDVLRESIEAAVSLAREKTLLSYYEVPGPWRINPHIINGYRFKTTPRGCIASIFQPSNELVNIWSHIIGLLIVLAVAFYFYPLTANFSLSTKTDVAIAAVFFAAAVKCLVCSISWHTMNSISDQPLMECFACVDYTGISLLVAASIVTTEYTAFYCEPVSRWSYICITGLMGVVGSILPWHPRFNGHDMAWARVSFYMFLGALGLSPIVQLTYTRGFVWAVYFYAPVMKSILVYTLGACVYASKIPERWWPGCFDYAGCSHNIWHLAVLGGILFHYTAMQELFSGAFLRKTTECAVAAAP